MLVRCIGGVQREAEELTVSKQEGSYTLALCPQQGIGSLPHGTPKIQENALSPPPLRFVVHGAAHTIPGTLCLGDPSLT